MSWKHPLRKRLEKGEPVFGATITVPSTEVAAQLAAAGFDFLWVEMEHSPLTLESLRNVVLATRGLPALPLARVPVNQAWTAKRVLDTGVAGVIFPFTSTADLARQAVAACKYPPAGLRGAGARLAAFRWPFDDYCDTADREFLVVAVIEDARGLAEVDAIAAVEGVDVLFIGTGDLSFSLGLRGKQDSPLLDEAVSGIAAAARRHGKYLGRPAFPESAIPRYVDRGFLFFQAETDVGLMLDGARGFLSPFGRGGKKDDLGV